MNCMQMLRINRVFDIALNTHAVKGFVKIITIRAINPYSMIGFDFNSSLELIPTAFENSPFLIQAARCTEDSSSQVQSSFSMLHWLIAQIWCLRSKLLSGWNESAKSLVLFVLKAHWISCAFHGTITFINEHSYILLNALLLIMYTIRLRYKQDKAEHMYPT